MKKKTNFLIHSFIPTIVGMSMLLMLTNACQKDKPIVKKNIIKKPTLTTTTVTSITKATASSGGNISSNGGASVTARGVCWSTSAAPTVSDDKTTDGTGKGIFTSNLTALTANTTYYVRAYATNSKGTAYGAEKSFTTSTTIVATVPVLTTTTITSITKATASSGGNISSNGGASVTARGVCWSTSAAPTVSDDKTTDGTGKGIFTSNLTALTANTTYYVRAYATNSKGTAYGTEKSFTTKKASASTTTITDVDGNVYNTVVIGTQTWMVEDLKVTKLNDGSPIKKLLGDNKEFDGFKKPGYCWSKDQISNKDQGALYNAYAINTGKLAPTGWHIPTKDEWETLINFLGGSEAAGEALRETGTVHWEKPNTATNTSGFTAIRAGYLKGSFYDDEYNFWWSSTPAEPEKNTDDRLLTLMIHGSYKPENVSASAEITDEDGFLECALHVRCVKD
jgi:uncharacterized protein (TIGR02145 family)